MMLLVWQVRTFVTVGEGAAEGLEYKQLLMEYLVMDYIVMECILHLLLWEDTQ